MSNAHKIAPDCADAVLFMKSKVTVATVVDENTSFLANSWFFLQRHEPGYQWGFGKYLWGGSPVH